MKTNRRGFFGALVGLASGVYAAFAPKAKGSEPVSMTRVTGAESEVEIDWIQLKEYGESPIPKRLRELEEPYPCIRCLLRTGFWPDCCFCEKTNKTGWHVMDRQMALDKSMIGEVGSTMSMCGKLW